MPTRPPAPPLLLLFLLLAAASAAHGRAISGGGGSLSLLPGAAAAVLRLPSEAAPPAGEEKVESGGCEMTYGFLPCTGTALGNLFLVLAYGFLMFKAATHLSAGSELLLQILGPGVVGGLFLPILGALPDAMLILGPLPSPIHHLALSLSPATVDHWLIVTLLSLLVRKRLRLSVSKIREVNVFLFFFWSKSKR